MTSSPLDSHRGIPDFPVAAPWTDYPRFDIAIFKERFPDAVAAPRYDNVEELLEYFADAACLIVTGNIRVSAAQLAELKKLRTALIVDGNLHVEGALPQVFHVSGDIWCSSADLASTTPHAYTPGTRLIASNHVSLIAEDHEIMNDAPALRVQTPCLFSWFYSIDALELADDTLVFILADADYCNGLTISNIVFPWHTSIHVLQPRHTWVIGGSGSDEMFWNLESIESAIAAGESLFIAGFNPQCMRHQQAGDEAFSMKDYRTAYLHYKASARLSPACAQAWQDMGDSLSAMAAFEQALACYRQAAAHFSARQRQLTNKGLSMGALSAIRLGQYPLALELASQCIASDESEQGYWTEDLAFALRVRAEAHLLLGARQSARSDLAKSLELNEWLGSANWLMGLVHHLQGDEKQASTFQQRAIDRSESFAASYETAHSTNALNAAPIRVDWDQAGPVAEVVKDEAYWCRFLGNNDPEKIKAVPEALRTPAVCLAALQRMHALGNTWAQFAVHFPPGALVPEVADHLVRLGGVNLRYLPTAMVTKPRCMLAPPPAGQFDASAVPEAVFDEELARHAVDCGARLPDIPPRWVTKELCLRAIRYRVYALDDEVPAALLDDDCYVAAIAYGDPYSFDRIPGIYKTPAMLKRAVTLDIRALDGIAGHAFDAELHAYAKQLYGGSPHWQEVVARHSPAAFMTSDGKCAEGCWRAFWSEDFMLGQIAKEDYNLSPYEIPADAFTQAVANACFEREPIHLDKIPLAFVDARMCKRFIARYPDMLDHVPVALRTQAICDAAMAEDLRQLPSVPLAYRTVDMCCRAIEEDKRLAHEVPVRIASKVVGRHGEFASFAWKDPAEPVDFDTSKFEWLVDVDAKTLLDRHDFRGALATLCLARQMLLDAGNDAPLHWAPVLDGLRRCGNGLQQPEESAAACEEALRRLRNEDLWPYIKSDEPIREALRNALDQLGRA